jgi:hypothetical protein
MHFTRQSSIQRQQTTARPLTDDILPSSKKLAKSDFEALSEFRYQLRRFLHFSEQAAESEGLTPQQYLLLLHIKGYPHGALALVSRCEAAGLISRVQGEKDRRQVLISLTVVGEERLEALATLHRTELQSLISVFQVANISTFNDKGQQDAAPST